MTKVSDIIFCLNSTNVPGQGVSAHTILTTITPEYIPGLFSFSLIITLLGLDILREHALKLSFSIDDEQVASLESVIPVMPTDGDADNSNLPKEYQGINISIDWDNVNFKKSGEYVLCVIIDGETVGEKKIFAKGRQES